MPKKRRTSLTRLHRQEKKADEATADGDEAGNAESSDEDDDVPSLKLLLKSQTQNGKPGWTDEADKYIMAYVERHGKTGNVWEELSERFGRQRSASGVRSRWYQVAGPSANVKGGWVQKRKRPMQGEDSSMSHLEKSSASHEADGASPASEASSPGVARTSSRKGKQRVETAAELGIATRDMHDSRTPAAPVIGPPLPQRPGRTAFYLAGVSPHLTCSLCNKLFTDAHTIRECLHTFCKTCVDSHIDEFRNCPECGIKVRNGAADAPIRSDRALQSLVDKINAVLKERGGDEDEDEDEEGDASLHMASPENKERAARKALSTHVAREGGHALRISLTPVPQEQSVGSDDPSQVATSASSATSPAPADSRAVSPTAKSPNRTHSPKLRRTRLAVSDRVTVFHLKQFLKEAFAVRSVKQVEVLCVGAALGDDMSLEYVLKTHWRGYAHDELLTLHYQMREA